MSFKNFITFILALSFFLPLSVFSQKPPEGGEESSGLEGQFEDGFGGGGPSSFPDTAPPASGAPDLVTADSFTPQFTETASLTNSCPYSRQDDESARFTEDALQNLSMKLHNCSGSEEAERLALDITSLQNAVATLNSQQVTFPFSPGPVRPNCANYQRILNAHRSLAFTESRENHPRSSMFAFCAQSSSRTEERECIDSSFEEAQQAASSQCFLQGREVISDRDQNNIDDAINDGVTAVNLALSQLNSNENCNREPEVLAAGIEAASQVAALINPLAGVVGGAVDSFISNVGRFVSNLASTRGDELQRAVRHMRETRNFNGTACFHHEFQRHLLCSAPAPEPVPQRRTPSLSETMNDYACWNSYHQQVILNQQDRNSIVSLLRNLDNSNFRGILLSNLNGAPISRFPVVRRGENGENAVRWREGNLRDLASEAMDVMRQIPEDRLDWGDEEMVNDVFGPLSEIEGREWVRNGGIDEYIGSLRAKYPGSNNPIEDALQAYHQLADELVPNTFERSISQIEGAGSQEGQESRASSQSSIQRDDRAPTRETRDAFNYFQRHIAKDAYRSEIEKFFEGEEWDLALKLNRDRDAFVNIEDPRQNLHDRRRRFRTYFGELYKMCNFSTGAFYNITTDNADNFSNSSSDQIFHRQHCYELTQCQPVAELNNWSSPALAMQYVCSLNGTVERNLQAIEDAYLENPDAEVCNGKSLHELLGIDYDQSTATYSWQRSN